MRKDDLVSRPAVALALGVGRAYLQQIEMPEPKIIHAPGGRVSFAWTVGDIEEWAASIGKSCDWSKIQ